MQLPQAKSFEAFLRLEKGLSLASVEAYLQDLKKLHQYMEIHELNKSLSELDLKDLQLFITYLNELELSINSQARIISSLKSVLDAKKYGIHFGLDWTLQFSRFADDLFLIRRHRAK